MVRKWVRMEHAVRVVNDKGRYRQHRARSRVPKLLGILRRGETTEPRLFRG